MYNLFLGFGMLVFIFSNNILASQTIVLPSNKDSLPLNNLLCLFSSKGDLSTAKSGCCSWHGGVCGCTGSHQLCCDGTISSSCTCNSK